MLQLVPYERYACGAGHLPKNCIKAWATKDLREHLHFLYLDLRPQTLRDSTIDS